VRSAVGIGISVCIGKKATNNYRKSTDRWSYAKRQVCKHNENKDELKLCMLKLLTFVFNIKLSYLLNSSVKCMNMVVTS